MGRGGGRECRPYCLHPLLSTSSTTAPQSVACSHCIHGPMGSRPHYVLGLHTPAQAREAEAAIIGVLRGERDQAIQRAEQVSTQASPCSHPACAELRGEREGRRGGGEACDDQIARSLLFVRTFH